MPDVSKEAIEQRRKANSQNDDFAWLGCLIPVLLIVFVLYQCSGTKSTSQCDDNIEAFVISQDFVKRKLRSPSTADFPLISSNGVYSNQTTLDNGRCAFNVRIYVDAQNAFGGTVRNYFNVTVAPKTPTSREWELISISSQ